MNPVLTPKERFLKALRREEVDRPPIPSFCTHPLFELMDTVGVRAPEIHYQLEAMVRFALSTYEVLGFEGVRLPTDSVFEVEAMGCDISQGDREKNPSVLTHPFSLDALRMQEDFLRKGRIPLFLKAVTAVKKRVGETIPVTAHFMGPMTIASHLVSGERLLLGLIEQPEVARGAERDPGEGF